MYGTGLVALDSQAGDRIWMKPTTGLDLSKSFVADEATGTVLLAFRAGIEAFGAANGRNAGKPTPYAYSHLQYTTGACSSSGKWMERRLSLLSR